MEEVTNSLHTAADTVPADRLAELEVVIERGLDTFVDVGMALLAIKMDKLYAAAGFTSFEAYVDERWNINKRYANRLIVAASISQTIITELGPIGPAPTNESQVRPLVALPEAERAEAWQQAVEVAGGKVPAAAVVADAVRARQNKPLAAAADKMDHLVDVLEGQIDIFENVATGGELPNTDVVRNKLAKALPTKPAIPVTNIRQLPARQVDKAAEIRINRAKAALALTEEIKRLWRDTGSTRKRVERWTPATEFHKTNALKAARDLEMRAVAMREAIEALEVEP